MPGHSRLTLLQKLGELTDGPHKLSGAYLARARADARERVALAGARLSSLLQQSLREGP